MFKPMLPQWAHALVTAFCLMSPAAWAAQQIYRCDVNGALVLQQTPCASGQSNKPGTVDAPHAMPPKSSPHNKVPSVAAPSLGNVTQPAPAAAPFRCDGRKYCPEMNSCSEAKYFLAHCPGVKLDGDNDGIPCETQWCQ